MCRLNSWHDHCWVMFRWECCPSFRLCNRGILADTTILAGLGNISRSATLSTRYDSAVVSGTFCRAHTALTASAFHELPTKAKIWGCKYPLPSTLNTVQSLRYAAQHSSLIMFQVRFTPLFTVVALFMKYTKQSFPRSWF